MKLAMVSTPFVSVPPRDYGGTELVVHELVEGLVGLGHDVTLFATWDSQTRGRLRSLYEAACWPPDPLHDLNHVSWAMQEIERSGFDLVHAHSAAALACSRFLPELPLAYTIHHTRDENFSDFYRYYPQAHYVAISEDQARREVELPNMHVIHHGLAPDEYQWRDRAGDYVCFIGRLSEVKGPHVAIDAARRAGVPIRVAGRIHEEDREFGDLEVEPRLQQAHVTFLGPVGPEEKVPLFRDARAMLMPIDWNEPFGLVMIEAMLSGCPVVAFPRGSVPEIVEDGLTGYVVSNQAELEQVIRPGGPLDEFDRRRCRERAVERFSNERMVRAHEKLYREILEGPGATANPGNTADAA